jgi:hypothetical protein
MTKYDSSKISPALSRARIFQFPHLGWPCGHQKGGNCVVAARFRFSPRFSPLTQGDNMPEYVQGSEELLPEGVYDFTVIDATEKTSKAGNPTIELQLLIKDDDGGEVRIFDHLTFSPRCFWKIDAFRVATGETLERGKTASFEYEDCLSREGRLLLKVAEFEGRERNKVGTYVDPAAEKRPPKSTNPF